MLEKFDIFCWKWVKVNLPSLQLGTKVKDGNNKSLIRAESGIKGSGVYVSSLGVGERCVEIEAIADSHRKERRGFRNEYM